MGDERKKTLWPWIVAMLIAVPVLYVASFGPACWITSRQDDPHDVFNALYFPLCKWSLALGEPAWGCLVGYGGLGMSAGTSLMLPTGQTGERLSYHAKIDK
jgi:hypothetical protein